MKVLRLNEADSNTILSVKNKFESDPDNNSKLQTLKGFLINQCNLDSSAWHTLERLGVDFLGKWMEAFKWEEAGRPGNEFIAFINNPSADHVLANRDRFIKAYNCYAANLLNDAEDLEDNPLYSNSIYRYSADDIKQIMNYWCQSIEKYKKAPGTDIEKQDEYNRILNSFYEKNGDVRTLAEITQILKNSDVSSSKERDQKTLRSLLQDEDNKKLAAEILKNEDNNLQ